MADFDNHQHAVGARGGGFGLDAELARKREAKYDHRAEDEARAWIETITNEPCEGPFGQALRDGVLLCKLVNCISAGSVRRINESRMPFKQMENISNFLKACRALGVAEHSLFETVDLYENKDLGLVVRCLFALGSAVQLTCQEFVGPHLGAKLHQGNKRVFSEQQKQQARINASFSKITMGSAHSMERSQVSRTGITFGAENAGVGDTKAMGKLTQGSHGIQERLPVDSSKSITFGAEKVGTGDSTVMTKASAGSYGIMERQAVSKANNITFGAETAGTGDTSVPGKLYQGSHGIQEGLPVDTSNSATFGAENSGRSDSSVITQPYAEHERSPEIMENEGVPDVSSITLDAESKQGEVSVVEKGEGLLPELAASSVIGSDSVDEANKSWFQARSG